MMIYGFCRRHLSILFVLQSWCIKSFCPLRNFPCWNFPFLLWAQRLFDFQLELFLSQLFFKVNITFSNFLKSEMRGGGWKQEKKKVKIRNIKLSQLILKPDRALTACTLPELISVCGWQGIVNCICIIKYCKVHIAGYHLNLGLCVSCKITWVKQGFEKCKSIMWPLVSGKIENTTRWPITPLLSYQASGQ